MTISLPYLMRLPVILKKDTPENNQQQKHVLVPDANVHVVGEEKTEFQGKKIQKENKREKRIDR